MPHPDVAPTAAAPQTEGTAPPRPPTPIAARRGARRTLAGLSLGYFVILLDTTIVSVAEPDLVADLHATTAQLQWVVGGYAIALAASLLLAGAIADRYRADRVFRIGIAVFGALSLLTVFAPTVEALIALRVAMGAAAALCIPSSMAVLAEAFPAPASRARAISIWAATSGLALAAGPLVGGLLVTWAGWRLVFAVNGPLVLIVLGLVAGAAAPASIPARRVAVGSQLCVALTLVALTGTLIVAGAGEWGWAIALAAATVAGVGVTVVVERRSASPVLPRPVVRAPGMLPALVAGAAVSFVLTGLLFALPMLLVDALSLNALGTGLLLLPLTIPCAVNPLLTGRLVARHGPRPSILAGLGLLTAGGVLLAVAAAVQLPPVLLAVALGVIGCGVSSVLPAAVAATVQSAPPGTTGTASGLLNAGRQVGAAIGVALMGALLPLPVGAPGAVSFLVAAAVAALALLCGASPRRLPAGLTPSR